MPKNVTGRDDHIITYALATTYALIGMLPHNRCPLAIYGVTISIA